MPGDHAGREYYAVVTLKWWRVVDARRQLRQTVGRNWTGTLVALPGQRRAALAEEAVARARDEVGAPGEALLLFLSLEPNEL